MANLRRSIYIGIGGAGVKAIAHTKKMFEDAFGEGNIPEAIQFLAIDSDFAALYDSLHPAGMSECAVRVKSDVGLPEFYTLQNHLGRINWMFPENVRLILPRLGLGSGQVRTNGRLFIELCMSEVLDGIRHRYNRVMNAPINHWGSVDIHIVCSLAGGTGSGAFIPLACMIRDLFGDRVNIFGYGLMYGVFRAMDVTGVNTPNVCINTYAAVLDLDYFQSATGSRPVKMSIAGHDIVITDPLFDRYFLWDNISENGFMLTSLDEICRMMASALYVYGAEAGAEIDLRLHACDWKKGTYNIYDKMGWVHRMSVCEVVYDGESVADMYAHEAKRVLVNALLECGEVDGSETARKWLEMVGVRDAERECKKLLDSICSPAVMSGLCKVGLHTHDSYDEVCKKVKQYVENFQSPIDGESVASFCEYLRGSLWESVSASMKSQGGVQEVRSFLDALWWLFERFSDELRCQITDLTTHIQHVGNVQLADMLQGYEKETQRWFVFSRRSAQKEILDDVAQIAKNILDLKVEVFRREAAIEIFKILKCEAELALAKVEEVHKTLREIFHKCSEKLSRGYSSRIQSVMTFDVSLREMCKITIGVDDVSVDDFLVSLVTPVMDMTSEELSTALDKYCASLSRCEEYRSRLLSDEVRAYTDEERERMKAQISHKLSPLLQLSPYAHRAIEVVCRNSVAIFSQSEKMNDDWVHKGLPHWEMPDVVASTSQNLRQKMMVCRVDAAVIPYVINCLSESVALEYKTALSLKKENPHIDRQIYEDMMRRDFNLRPEGRLWSWFYWVCGQISGDFIRYYDGMYWYRGVAIHGEEQWYPMDTQRHASFRFLQLDLLRSGATDRFANCLLKQGLNNVEAKIKDVIAGGKQNYINAVCHNEEAEDNCLEFIDQEWDFIEHELWHMYELFLETRNSHN